MKTICSAVLILALGAQVANADFIVNGSFEADNWGAQTLGLVGNDVTGWYIPSSNGTYPWGTNKNTYNSNNPDGDQFFILGYWGGGGTPIEYSIQQTMTGLTAGDLYTLDFWISSEAGSGAKCEVSFLDGSSTPSQVFHASQSGQWWTNWTEQSMNFLATSDTVTLQFKQLDPDFNNGIDVGLDAVSVELVPVPGAALLGMIGLSAVGIKLRKHA